MAKNVAEVFVETLIAAGVKRVYGVAGDSLNALTEAIRRHDAIAWIPVRHEEAAAFAAGADAHLTGTIAVCAGSCGPGNLHLINGLFDCHRSRVPVLAIAAQIPSREIGSGFFQETHPEQLFKDCSHFCELISHASQIPRILGIALRTALVKRGVAVIVMPGDIALCECSSAPLSVGILDPASIERPADSALGQAAGMLNHAQNQKARKELDELAVGEPGHTPIHPQYVARVLDEVAADDAVFICDVGTPTIWAARR